MKQIFDFFKEISFCERQDCARASLFILSRLNSTRPFPNLKIHLFGKKFSFFVFNSKSKFVVSFNANAILLEEHQ